MFLQFKLGCLVNKIGALLLYFYHIPYAPPWVYNEQPGKSLPFNF